MDGYRFDTLTRSLAGGVSRRGILRGLGGALVAAAGSRLRAAGAAQEKKPLCHATGDPANPWVVIDVAEPAWDTHFAHGDFDAVNRSCTATCSAPSICGPDDQIDLQPCGVVDGCFCLTTIEGTNACVGGDSLSFGCTASTQCGGGVCVADPCDSSVTFCLGLCPNDPTDLLPNNFPCTDDAQCLSGICNQVYQECENCAPAGSPGCSRDAECCDGSTCVFTEFGTGICTNT